MPPYDTNILSDSIATDHQKFNPSYIVRRLISCWKCRYGLPNNIHMKSAFIVVLITGVEVIKEDILSTI